MTIAVAGCATLVTLLANGFGSIDVGLRSPAGHVAIDSIEAVLAVVAAYLMFARFARRGGLAELTLVAGLLVSSGTALCFGAIPASARPAITRFMTWSLVAGALVSAVLFAIAAVTRRPRVRDLRAAIVSVSGFCLATLGLIALVAAIASPHLPLALNPSLSPNAGHNERVIGNAGVLGASLACALLYAAAAVGFMRRSVDEDDELFGWFALTATLLAFAWLNYFLFPSRYSHWLFVGDWLRLAAYAVVLLAAAREIAAYQRGVAAAAILEERRRLARELHDGLAQELAFISTQSRRLLAGPGDRRRLEQLALAAERALDESRSAIRTLTRRLDEPLEIALAQAAEDVAERVGVSVRLDLAPDVDVPPATREALLRIVREAVSNTARHGRASQVTMSLVSGHGTRLVIADDGVGFDTEAERDGVGFGLVSMHERAQAFGGELVVRSAPGEGTRIEVVIP